jgi:hypothetical protein
VTPLPEQFCQRNVQMCGQSKTRTSIDRVIHAKLHSVQMSQICRPNVIVREERLLESVVLVIEIERFPYDTRSVNVTVQVNEQTTATDERLSEKEMDSLLCGYVTVCSHLCEQTLNSTFGWLCDREPCAEILQHGVVRVRESLGFAGIFADIPPCGFSVQHGLHVNVSSPTK